MPVAGRDLRQQREDGVPEVARARDHLPRLAQEEPVRLRVLDLARATGSTGPWSSAGSIWLSAAITQATSISSASAFRWPRRWPRRHLGSPDVGSPPACRVPRRRGALSRVASRGRRRRRRRGRRSRGSRRSSRRRTLLVVGEDDDRDPLPVEHQPEETARRRTNGSAAKAATAPTRSPTSAPTRSDVRLERAVVLLAAAGSTTRLFSTFSARLRSCCAR